MQKKLTSPPQPASLDQPDFGPASDDRQRYLEAANQRLQLALSASGMVGLWDWMVNTDLLYGDPNFAHLYGLDPVRTAAGLTMADYQQFVVPEDLAALRKDIRDTFEHGADFFVEYRLAIPGQALRWIECKGRLIEDASGQPVRFSGTAVDVTQRKQRDQALRADAVIARENAERVQLALAAGAIIGTWVWQIQAQQFTADEGFATAFAVDPALARSGLRMQQVMDTVHPDDQPELAAAINDALARGGPFKQQYRVRRAGQQYYWVEAAGRVELDAAGLALRFPGVLIDITERREMEAQRDRIAAELRDFNMMLEQRIAERTAERDSMWATSPDLLLMTNVDGVCLRVNPAWTRTLGYLPEEFIGCHMDQWIVGEERAEGTEPDGAVRSGELARVVNRYLHKDGTERWISWSSARAGDMVFSTGRDITAERARAAALDAAQDVLRQSQKMEAVGQLTGGLAHDFNNLLAGISGSLQLLNLRVQRGQFQEIERYLLIAQNGVKRAASLTHRLLAFSRRQTLDPKPADINRLVREMHDLVQRTVGPAITVAVADAADVWPALVDASQLENALLNLCINARDAMPDGGSITIATANQWLDERAGLQHDLLPGQYLSLCVTDTGTGIAPDILEKVFDPFFTTKPLGEGTGLGLSMVYGFAKQSGGQVRVVSEVGTGTTFCIYLPRHHGAVEDVVHPEELAPCQASASKRTVLVVDDEPMILTLMVEILGELGYHALQASDSATGLKILQSDVAIDLLVSDVGLPGGLNGRQMADAARLVRPDLKVLFITGYAENAAIGNGHLMEGMQVMTKPFDMQALTAHIRAMVENRF